MCLLIQDTRYTFLILWGGMHCCRFYKSHTFICPLPLYIESLFHLGIYCNNSHNVPVSVFPRCSNVEPYRTSGLFSGTVVWRNQEPSKNWSLAEKDEV